MLPERLLALWEVVLLAILVNSDSWEGCHLGLGLLPQDQQHSVRDQQLTVESLLNEGPVARDLLVGGDVAGEHQAKDGGTKLASLHCLSLSLDTTDSSRLSLPRILFAMSQFSSIITISRTGVRVIMT